MNAPSSAPVDWRSMYGFGDSGVQSQMSPYMANLWSHNIGNSAKEAIATNFMPYVMNPASISLDPAVNKANMYSKPGGGAGGAGMPGMGGAMSGGDPMSQILGLIQTTPELIPVLLQALQSQSSAATPAIPGG